MKVIMLKDHLNIGKLDEVIEVSDGFGQNFLLNKGIAVLATKEELEKRTERKDIRDKENKESLAKSTDLSIQIKDAFLNIYRDSHNGRMFGSVTSSDISDELEKEGIEINKKKIKLNKVNTFGSFTCIIDCGNNIKEELSFIVEEN